MAIDGSRSQGLGIQAEFRDETLVLELHGDLDMLGAPELERRLRRLDPEVDVLALDLTDVRFIDSSGLRLLLVENERAAAAGYRLVLTGVRGPVLTTLRLTGLDRVLPIAPAIAL